MPVRLQQWYVQYAYVSEDITVLSRSNFHELDIASYSVLKCVEVELAEEPVNEVLGHNVAYRGSMSRLSILVLKYSKGSQRERGGGMPKITSLLQSLQAWMNLDVKSRYCAGQIACGTYV